MQKWPSEFDQDLFHYYQRFVLLAEKGFLAHRSSKHHLRIVCFHYLMLKQLLRRKWLEPDKREVEMRLLPTRLEFVFGQKSVIGIAVVIHFSSSYERFEDQHILFAVQKILPHVQAVHESFWAFQKPRESFRLLYLEIEKKLNTSPFSLSEITLLKKNLKEELKKHVETLNPSTFGTNDVEETMRNIFFLSQELRTTSDLPQVMISFEKALISSLVFKVVMVRLLNEQSRPISEYFLNKNEVGFQHESTSIVEYLFPNKFPKEASVFRLHIPKQASFIRSDFSFNLYQVREYIYFFLANAFGKIRDYNGGIFFKQLELFCEFKNHFKKIADRNPELLENFFHSISPPEMQATLSFPLLAELFTLFLQVRNSSLTVGEAFSLQTIEKNEKLFAIALVRKSLLSEQATNLFDDSRFSSEIIASLYLEDHECVFFGCIYQNNLAEKRSFFCQVFQDHLKKYTINNRNIQSLHFTQPELPVSLDPRLGGDMVSETIIKMLFEGLFRIGKSGEPELAVARELFLSEDGKCYTIKLRDCYWNNGDQITAEDFCYSWRKILSPNFHSAFTYFFYPLRNAKQAKMGLVPLKEIGVTVLDDETLRIDLEYPCSYFLELLAHPIYSPVNHRIDLIFPNWHLQTGKAYVCNGPFQLEDFDYQESYKLRKNFLYWDQYVVSIDEIRISKANSRKALEMFQREENDWLGRPFCPWESFFPQNENLHSTSVNYVYWYVFNVKQFPFHSQKLRQALAYALDRQAVIDLLKSEAMPAFSPVPYVHTQFPELYLGRNVDYARELFNAALQEMGITLSDLPSITLICPNLEIRKQIAATIIEGWHKTLGIIIKIEYINFKDLFLRMTEGKYQIGVLSWWSLVNDPSYTLDIFKNAEEGINFCKWEQNQYRNLMEKATLEEDIIKRKALYAKAEEILIKEVPVIPIFHQKEPFMKKKYIKSIFKSQLGTFDFKYSYINKEVNDESNN